MQHPHILLLLASSSLLLLPLTHGLSIVEVTPSEGSPQKVEKGQGMTLSCRADYSFEHCVWRHSGSGQVCEFEWKRADDAITMQRCSKGIAERIHIENSVYSRHECQIHLTDVGSGDAGEWSCEMESYVWGPARGSTDRKTLQVTVVANEEEEEDVASSYNDEHGGGRAPGHVDHEEDPDEEQEYPQIDVPVTVPTSTASTTTIKNEEEKDRFDAERREQETWNRTLDFYGHEDTTEDRHNISQSKDESPMDLLDASSSPQGRINEEEDDDNSEMFPIPYIGIVLGSIMAILAVVVIIAAITYRRRRSGSSKIDNELGGEKKDYLNNGTANHKVEMSNILEENENEEEESEEGCVKVEVTSQRMTYQGSRTVAYEDKI